MKGDAVVEIKSSPISYNSNLYTNFVKYVVDTQYYMNDVKV